MPKTPGDSPIARSEYALLARADLYVVSESGTDLPASVSNTP